MGCINREENERASLPEAILFTTMCIIGLPVDVHVKDGSVYSGIFHTACLDKGYDVILKKAIMKKGGKHGKIIPSKEPIETLVILSRDLVQVVAKGVPSQIAPIGVVNSDGLDGFHNSILSPGCVEIEGKTTKLRADVNEKITIQTRNNFSVSGAGKGAQEELMYLSCRDDGLELMNGKFIDKKSNSQVVNKSQGGSGDDKQHFKTHKEDIMMELAGPSLNSDSCAAEGKLVEKLPVILRPKVFPDVLSCSDITSSVPVDDYSYKRSTSAEVDCSGVMSSFASITPLASESFHSKLPTSHTLMLSESYGTNRSTKESKLNPGAKVFSPAFSNIRPPVTSIPTVSTMAYIPSNRPLVNVDAAETVMGTPSLPSRSSLPLKLVPYGNLVVENAASNSQYNQSIIGYPGTRMHPVRQAGAYRPVQVGHAYVPANPQAVVVGRLGQVVYAHPTSQEAVHGPVSVPPISTRPLLIPHQGQFPKHQGYAGAQAMPLCAPPPLVTTGQQPFAVPNHVQFLAPTFLTNRPLAFPGSNGLLGTKF